MTFRKLEINRAIKEIEKPYPPNGLIRCYKDFLKHRNVLHLYQYNPNVLNSLISLALDLWKTSERISRSSMIMVIKRYIKVHQEQVNLPAEIKSKLFELFREIIYYDHLVLDGDSKIKLRKAINRSLMGVSLKDRELEWLCDHANHSEHILNRILRYPEKSAIISNWARENFANDLYRYRRAEMTAWLLDEEPDYVLDKQVLIDDFEYSNLRDKKAIRAYKEELAATTLMNEELRELDIRSRTSDSYAQWDEDPFAKVLSLPTLQLTKRFYSIPTKDFINHNQIPDFPALEEQFYADLEQLHRVTMIWVIGYSRLDKDTKFRLIKEYYHEKLYISAFNVAKKIKNVELLKWLLENA